MIVPKYWAEGRLRDRINGRQVTVRRWGWSDESQAAAQVMADARTREALAEFIAGKEVERRELKRAYNGAEGVPIREEIIVEHGATVITRNSYGALCLNTPNVLFADIDYHTEAGAWLTVAIVGPLLAGAVTLGWFIHWGLGCVAAPIAIGVGAYLATILSRALVQLAGGYEEAARRRVDRFLSAHPHWHVRLYRTPAGLRALAVHQTFDPRDAAVAEFFQAIGADPIYVRMCQRQHCFRARVSPKPWRVGLSQHLKPRPGLWPINPERLPERQAWVRDYEEAARGYASCEFVAALGSGAVHPAATEVQRLHDDLCRANSGLPIA